MRLHRFAASTAVLSLLCACASKTFHDDHDIRITAQDAPAVKTVAVVGKDGQSSGSAILTAAPKGVFMKLELSGLTPGWHGIHFHEKGDCSAYDFTSAGSHVHGPEAVVHGLLNPAHSDLGDLPNIFVGADGKATVEIFSPFVSLGDAAGRQNLLDADGSAVVIHASADDHTSQPIGGAGARVACGVIK